MAKELTLGDHAELWWQEQGNEVPARNTDAWREMYERWATWAFADLREEKRPRRRQRSRWLMS